MEAAAAAEVAGVRVHLCLTLCRLNPHSADHSSSNSRLRSSPLHPAGMSTWHLTAQLPCLAATLIQHCQACQAHLQDHQWHCQACQARFQDLQWHSQAMELQASVVGIMLQWQAGAEAYSAFLGSMIQCFLITIGFLLTSCICHEIKPIAAMQEASYLLSSLR